MRHRSPDMDSHLQSDDDLVARFEAMYQETSNAAQQQPADLQSVQETAIDEAEALL